MTQQDPFTGIAIFIAAAREGSFTQAAERMGVTKSAVGKAIARLEARLGVTLFHRTTRITRLTADGEAFLASCTMAMEEVAAAQASLSSAGRELSGRLRVDMPVAFGRSIIMPILIRFAQQHPAIHLSLTFSDATSDLIQDDIDLAIRFGPSRDATHLMTRHLATQPRVICAAPSYLARYGTPAGLEHIDEHRCILGSPKGPPQVWFVQDRDKTRRLTPPATHSFSDGEAMVAAAVAGLGLIQMPHSILRDHLASGALQPVLEHASTQVDLHLLWPRQAHLRPRLRHLIDLLVDHATHGDFG
jgi:DNA-binding transcriptional LysR family regulator